MRSRSVTRSRPSCVSGRRLRSGVLQLQVGGPDPPQRGRPGESAGGEGRSRRAGEAAGVWSRGCGRLLSAAGAPGSRCCGRRSDVRGRNRAFRRPRGGCFADEGCAALGEGECPAVAATAAGSARERLLRRLRTLWAARTAEDRGYRRRKRGLQQAHRGCSLTRPQPAE
ncbi:hypothetical protein PAL_GLEAN10020634 [Pteropus alecto]|uniref:Uncharacterized protein n=1 Tax=Pteropus alecto TaxID=9402 RepID=L5JNP9_PTEAL|nr:hypothetical protein PAL_GLEAN10020634 [Pteropus alecto]